MIAAMVLIPAALIMFWYAFFSGGSSTPTRPANQNASSGGRTVAQATPAPASRGANIPTPDDLRNEQLIWQPISAQWAPPPVPEAGRNIFAYYVPPPKPSPSPVVKPSPVPTPTPSPPQLIASISPTNVYARQSEFKLEVSGDKFTPATRITINGAELPTQFKSPQQLSATVPSAMIAGEGARQIMTRTPDGKLFSNSATLNVAQPPAPNYLYVGILGGPRYNDTAVLKDKSSKDLVNVQRGDLVGGRFRVTSISEREVTLTDTSLRIKHTLPIAAESGEGRAGQPRNVPPQRADDDEP
jgi:hypothetical protein